MCASIEAPQCREAGSGAERHAATPEPTAEAGRGPEPQDAWRRQSPPVLDGVWSHRTRDYARVHLSVVALVRHLGARGCA
jgi:hypothetical protein